MSAFLYLAFVLGIVVIAVYGAVMAEIYNPMIDQTETVAETQHAATGADWLGSFFELLPILLFFMLVFVLIVGIVVRRNRVRV